MVASLPDGPVTQPPGIHTWSATVCWSMWSKAYGRSDGKSLLRSDLKRQISVIGTPVLSLSLSLITNSERSRLPGCGQSYEETQVTRKWSFQEELRPAQSPGSAHEAGMTAVPANSSTAPWWVLSQRHPAKPHPDSWPSETDVISVCCLGWFVTRQ